MSTPLDSIDGRLTIMATEVLLEKQRQLKERLALAGQQVETLERHELFMRYFDAKETAEKFISEVEQTSFALPGVKRGYEVVRKQNQVKRQPHSEEEQLEFQL